MSVSPWRGGCGALFESGPRSEMALQHRPWPKPHHRLLPGARPPRGCRGRSLRPATPGRPEMLTGVGIGRGHGEANALEGGLVFLRRPRVAPEGEVDKAEPVPLEVLDFVRGVAVEHC